MSDIYKRNCPRCDKTTNHTIKIEFNYEEHVTIVEVYQRCHNCDLFRQGIVTFKPWMFTEELDRVWVKEEVNQ